MKLACIFITVLAVFHLSATTAATAPEQAPLTPVALKAKAIVEAAHAYVLTHSDDMAAVQHALRTRPDFYDRDRDLYVFIHCYDIRKKEAVCCGQGARPDLVGKNMWHLRTPNGRLLFHEIAQMIERDGEGWIEYDWLNPYTKRLQTKLSYVMGIILKDGRKAWVGCGFWKEK